MSVHFKNGSCAKCGKVNFKLGLAGYSCNRLSVDDTLALLKRLDVNYLCIKNFHLPFEATDADIATFKQKCADHGVTGYGLGPIYMDLAQKDKVRTYFDFAKRVGVNTIVGVPFEYKMINGKKTRYESRALCEHISGLCKEYDIRYAIHNHGPDIPYLFPTGETSWNMVKDLDVRMGLCLDVGHDFRAKANPVDSIRKFYTRIYDMHIKNVKFDPVKNRAMPMPRGDMDMWAIVKALVEVGYTGVCSLEYESFPPKGEKPGIKAEEVAESIGYFKGLMKAAGC
ncbi:MAG: sugar phosphate isomerase/epimerase [Kiritimatiellae bacterium]|nr:sugar phosphate isomerase/epimerase [Kiritimatiellia bacterium]